MQVHQTKYLLDIGFSPNVAVWALGAVSLLGIPGQIGLGHLSDRIGREWIWTAGLLRLCDLLCGADRAEVVSDLDAGLSSWCWRRARSAMVSPPIMGAVVLEIFQGKHFGSIFGTVMLAALAGGAAGPWVTGLLHDLTGSYAIAFAIGIAVSGLSALAIWMASPGKVRAVAGQLHRLQPQRS